MNKIANYDWSHLNQDKNEYRNEFIKGGTRKIADIPRPCSHPEHNPPSHCVFEPGVYEHICPRCGNRIVFTVSGTFL